MSFLKATWWRPATAMAVLALAVLALSLSGGTAQAGDPGSVSVDPVDTDISAGGSGTVDINVDPPAVGTSVWIVQVKYDPAIVRVSVDAQQNPVCDVLANPGQGIAFAASCDVKDTDGNLVADTAVAFGGWVQNDGGTPKGFTTEQTIATFTFEAVGAAGTHSDLTIADVCPTPPATPPAPPCTTLLGPNAAVANPTLTDGGIDIIAAQGLTVAWGNGDCSPTLTSAPGPVDALKILFTDAGTPPTQTVTGCPAYGANVIVNGLTVAWGNFDCTPGGAPGPLDALKLLFVDAGTPPAQTVPNCPAYSSQVTITT